MSAVRLRLVRHGRAAGTFAEVHDPGLDPVGLEQALGLAERLAPLGPLPLVASPLRRTRETAAPLERVWGRIARIEPAVAEIPSGAMGLTERGEWLRRIMAGDWDQVEPGLRTWRESVVAALLALGEDTVVVTHYIAINVAVGHAVGSDRVNLFSPDHCSVTVLDVEDGRLRLVARGDEAVTRAL